MASSKFGAKLAKARADFHKQAKKGGDDGFELGPKPKIKFAKPPLMLVDGDIITFHVATATMVETYHRDRDAYTWEVDMELARSSVHERLDGLAQWMGATQTIVAFSSGKNFRKDLDPAYKVNRTGKKPLAYWAIVDYIKSKFRTLMYPRCEADDVLGIQATLPENLAKFTPVIVSDDKDMLTVPSHHLRLKKSEDPELQGIFRITPERAEWFHFRQSLAGDHGDGYRGLEGVGPKKAEKIIGGFRGKAAWKAVVKAYKAAGLSENDALRNARLARILQASEFVQGKEQVKLWNPPR